MDVHEAIEKRRSVRRFSPDPIPEDVLDRLLRSLQLAPSGSNRQPWTFIVVRDELARQRVASACRFTNTLDRRVHVQEWVAQAPLIVVACGHVKEASTLLHEQGGPFVANGRTIIDQMGAKPGEYTSAAPWDLAIALEHLALAATAEGLGTCWIGGLDEEEVKRVLAIPDDLSAQLLMPVGYAASAWPPPRPRKPLAEIVRYDSFV
jgi:nitroreductase